MIPDMKQSPPKPITIGPDLAARYTNSDQFERFDAAVLKVLSVSREEMLRREAEYKKQAALNPTKRGPKPKRSLVPKG
jgi:hypothetical protein